jgi:hypothetical protein
MFRKKNILPPAEFADEERQELFNEKNKKSAGIRHFFSLILQISTFLTIKE